MGAPGCLPSRKMPRSVGNGGEIYQEPELNALEDKLNVSNQNIAQSYDSFMAARAQVRQGAFRLLPDAERRALLHPQPVFTKPERRLHSFDRQS